MKKPVQKPTSKRGNEEGPQVLDICLEDLLEEKTGRAEPNKSFDQPTDDLLSLKGMPGPEPKDRTPRSPASNTEMAALTRAFNALDAKGREKLVAYGKKLVGPKKTKGGERKGLVKAKPEDRYDARPDRRVKVVDFIKEKYRDRLDGTFTRPDLKFVDDSAEKALRAWEQYHGSVGLDELKLPKERPRLGDLPRDIEKEADPLKRSALRRIASNRAYNAGR